MNKISISVCRNPNHKHIMARHDRVRVNKYGKLVKVIRVTNCK